MYSHKAPVKVVEFNRAGDYFASAGADSNVLVWKSNFDENMKRITPNDPSVQRGSLRRSATGKRAFSHLDGLLCGCPSPADDVQSE